MPAARSFHRAQLFTLCNLHQRFPLEPIDIVREPVSGREAYRQSFPLRLLRRLCLDGGMDRGFPLCDLRFHGKPDDPAEMPAPEIGACCFVRRVQNVIQDEWGVCGPEVGEERHPRQEDGVCCPSDGERRECA